MPAPPSDAAAATGDREPPKRVPSPPTAAAVDWAALKDPRARMMIPAVVLAAALPFLARAAQPLWIAASEFEDGIFSAINERRKKIHALEGESAIDDQDAFVIFTLTEIAARDLITRRGRDLPRAEG